MDYNQYYIIGGIVLLAILIALALILYRRHKNKVRPIKMPPRVTLEEQQRRLIVDIDTSPLTNPPKQEDASPYYLVFDTETAELVSPFDEDKPAEQTSHPIALSWQLRSYSGILIKEESYILRQTLDEPMKPEAIAIHGISNERLIEGVDPEGAYDKFLGDLHRSTTLVAHNLPFHRQTIVADLRRHGHTDWADYLENFPHTFCTMEWGRQLGFKQAGGEALYPRLDELFGHRFFGRMHLPLRYKSKTLRDVRLAGACLNSFIDSITPRGAGKPQS